MATKAQRFKAKQQRDANPPKKKRPRKPRRDEIVDTSQPGVSATDRKARRGSLGSTNQSKRAGNKGGAALEANPNGKPSRKSTRKSKGRVKRTTNLQRRKVRRLSAPKARAARSK